MSAVEEANPSAVRRAIIDLVSGSAGGVANVYVGQPLDTIKVKLQTFPHLYKGATQCGMNTFRTQGIQGLYAGTVPSLVANVAENAVLFLAYGAAQNLVSKSVGKQQKELNNLENACAGSLASIVSATVLTPIEMIKCRMQANQETAALKGASSSPQRVGPLRLARSIILNEGPLAPFKGLSAAIVREMVGYFFFFGVYEMVRESFVEPGKTKDDIGALRTILAGGLGGVALWIPSYPLDLVKSRIQVLHTGRGQAPNFVSVALEIVRKEGPQALYSGIKPTLLRAFPATGALFLAVEKSKKWMESLSA